MLLKKLLCVIKDDWIYRFPFHIKNNRYYGFSKVCFGFLCLLYYFMKTLVMLVPFLICVLFAILYYVFYGVYIILKMFFDRDSFCLDNEEETEDIDYDKSIEFIHNTNEYESSGFRTLWNSEFESDWKEALNHYWEKLRDDQKPLERYIENINADDVEKMTEEEFYNFLYHKYFVWKYTAKNRLATTRKSLQKYIENNELYLLKSIQTRLFNVSKSDVYKCLEIASEIRGLGIAGASGLISILFPESFGTVDQFVVKRLREVGHQYYDFELQNMNPDSLKINDGVILIEIMKDKADELNFKFDTDFWTPRKIDMVMWAFGR